MTERPAQLDRLQRWMLEAITDSSAAEAEGLGDIVLPSRQQSAGERLAVYNGAYFARLLEVLRELFPCTRFAIGEELFDQFAVGYLRAHRPHSYTLARLADRLADYLDATRPADWGQFVVDLVRLEQAIDRIFDAPGPEGLPPFVVPDEAGAGVRLSLVPGFELHRFSHPVSTFYTDWKAGREPAWRPAGEQFVALLRRDYVVRRFELTAGQYELLLAISRGQTLGEALSAAVEASDPCSPDDLAGEFRRWFTIWAANGFFAEAV